MTDLNETTAEYFEYLDELRESTVSLMPDNQLDEMTDQQIRDLLAYLQSDGPSRK